MVDHLETEIWVTGAEIAEALGNDLYKWHHLVGLPITHSKLGAATIVRVEMGQPHTAPPTLYIQFSDYWLDFESETLFRRDLAPINYSDLARLSPILTKLFLREHPASERAQEVQKQLTADAKKEARLRHEAESQKQQRQRAQREKVEKVKNEEPQLPIATVRFHYGHAIPPGMCLTDQDIMALASLQKTSTIAESRLPDLSLLSENTTDVAQGIFYLYRFQKLKIPRYSAQACAAFRKASCQVHAIDIGLSVEKATGTPALWTTLGASLADVDLLSEALSMAERSFRMTDGNMHDLRLLMRVNRLLRKTEAEKYYADIFSKKYPKASSSASSVRPPSINSKEKIRLRRKIEEWSKVD